MEANGRLVSGSRLQNFLIFAPPLFCLFSLVFPIWASFIDRSTFFCLVLTFWMVIWWVGAVLPLGITALLPIVYLPVLNLIPIKQVTVNYANPIIFLFLGGFMIARALEKTQLDERIALNILKYTGRSDRGIVLGFIIATAGLSMWISNTATTLMMVPIALSVIHFLKKKLPEKNQQSLKLFSVSIFLSIAYSANIGGIMTPIGTPPNVVFMSYLSELYGREIDFFKWMMICAPLALSLLVIMYFLLNFLFPFRFELPKNFSSFIKGRISELGPVSGDQSLTIKVFLMAASLWIFKAPINFFSGLTVLNDTSIAILAGLILFLVPYQENKNWNRVLNRDDIGKLPWDIVLLFGGGMALANALKSVGLIESITQSLGQYEWGSPYILILLIAALGLLLTEIMSNVALCVVALPIIMKFGESQDIDPILIGLPLALCASFAFSMPISTPPNAIVFGTQKLSMKHMLKAGLILNTLSFFLVSSLGYFLITQFI